MESVSSDFAVLLGVLDVFEMLELTPMLPYVLVPRTQVKDAGAPKCTTDGIIRRSQIPVGKCADTLRT
jgi:hypothetical protein